MVVTIMPSMNSLLQALRTDFPGISFVAGNEFYWSCDNNTVHFDDKEPNASFLLLHELAHAQLKHSQYERDIELIKMERDAWDYATSDIAGNYKIKIPTDLVGTTLDTYRDWLHYRSICPHCSAIGYQIKKEIYSCPTCQQTWRVNKAQDCALRRYKKV